MIFGLSKEQFDILHVRAAEAIRPYAKAKPIDPRQIESSMKEAHEACRREGFMMPPATALAFHVGDQCLTCFVWHDEPHYENVKVDPCDYYLGSLLDSTDPTQLRHVDLWVCSESQNVSAIGPDTARVATLASLSNALSSAQSVDMLVDGPIDLFCAARLAVRKIGN